MDFTKITDRIIKMLEDGVAPWKKPWTSAYPLNVRGTHYKGINSILLGIAGFSNPYWLTFKQAKQLGGHVKKGEKSTSVFFWKIMSRDFENEDGVEYSKTFPVAKMYNVFNLEQIELPETKAVKFNSTEESFEPVDKAEELLSKMTLPVIKGSPNKAAYFPSKDEICMPSKGSFSSPEEYYSTLFHELIHSTGHKDKLDRKFGASFGSDAYGEEELVAELGAAMLCGMTGISNETIDNSASYVSSWYKKLKVDPDMIIRAGSKAEKAVKFLIGD